jgi:aminoglycoside phosphotransferase (APT) family kinase protein
MITELDGQAGRVARWLADQAHVDAGPGPGQLRQLPGGNSNVTYLLTAGNRQWVVRRPPLHRLDRSAHSMAREWRLLDALAPTAVPAVRPVAYCQDLDVLGAEFLVLEYVPESVSITAALPPAYEAGPETIAAMGFALVDALVRAQEADWQAAGLTEFGRPAGFLSRQVPRWEAQYRRHQSRDIASFDRVARWLRDHQPAPQPAAVVHGDFHLDNCLFSAHRPELLAVVDWEMATIGDPLLDLGLLLAFWGRRACDPPGMPAIQAVTRTPGAPSRRDLAERYAQLSSRDVSGIRWYQVFALWKLAAIVEAAYAQFARGELRTDYAAALEQDVPLLLVEAEALITAPDR